MASKSDMSSNPIQRMRDIQHFGEEGGVVPVIDVAATSTFLDPLDMVKTFQGELEGCYLYSRHSNPSVSAFGKKLTAMEGMEDAIGLASGMAAITCAVLQVAPKGSHIVASRTVYGGTFAFFQNILPQWGIEVTFVDSSDPEAFKKAIQKNTCAFYTETLSNPLLNFCDIHSISKIAKKNNLSLIVDNTFTPLIYSPAKWGADIVVYSCTKYISGSSDLTAGAVVGSSEFIKKLKDVNTGMAMLLGPVMDPRVAHELYLRLDHLGVRMKAHSQSAQFFAEELKKENIPVIYPGLPTNPQYDLFSSQKNDFGYGGMLTIDCKTPEKVLLLASKLQKINFGLYAVSLGFSRSLLCCPALSTSSEIPEEDRNEMGLSPGLLRISLGYVGDDQIMTERFLSCYQQIMFENQNEKFSNPLEASL
jgi:methionine-gamma-lyase